MNFDLVGAPEQRAGCVSTAVRVVTSLEGTLDSCTLMTGDVVNKSTEGRVHSCVLVPTDGWDDQNVTCDSANWSTATPCDDAAVDFLDTQPQQQASSATFELHRLGDLGATDITCQTVRETLPAP